MSILRPRPTLPKPLASMSESELLSAQNDLQAWFEELAAHPHVQAVIKIPATEPIFVLRAQDDFAITAIQHWQVECVERGTLRLSVPEEKMTKVNLVVQAFADWQRANPDLVKIPD